ncbi:MAG TPA: hypothetical protein VGR96_15870 [Acidobacteriaceae bacterium]|nr:hypothetical protein [Acidobacteriaceae bacterium]
MASIVKPLAENVFLPAAAPATPGQYVAPASTTTTIKKATVCNTDAVAHLVTVYKVQSGHAAQRQYSIWYQRGLSPGQSMDIFELENHVLASGDFISAFADTASQVTFSLSGIETA